MIAVAGRQPMADGFLHLPLTEEPVSGTDGEGLNLVGFETFELSPQGVAEQSMALVPLASVVKSGDEAVGALELGENHGGVGAAQDRVAQWTAEPLQHRAAKEKSALVVSGPGENLSREVVQQVPVVAADHRGPLHRVRRSADAQRCQLQPRCPALGAVHHPGQGAGRQDNVGDTRDQRRRLLRREPEVRGPDLDQLPGRTQPGQRQRRVRPSGDHNV
jgi:hypothetical protein